MSISTFSQYQASIINDLNRFGDLDQIANTLTEMSNLGGILELANISHESVSHLGSILESMMPNSSLIALVGDVERLREEAIRTLPDQNSW